MKTRILFILIIVVFFVRSSEATVVVSSDNFNRADNTDENAGTGVTRWYDSQTGGLGCQISNNQLLFGYTNRGCQDILMPINSSNYTISFNATGYTTTESRIFYVAFYMNATGLNPALTNWNGYKLIFDTNTNNKDIYLYYINNTQTQIDVNISGNADFNASWKFNTTSFQLYRNNVLYHTFTSNTSFTSGLVGFATNNQAGQQTIDNYLVTNDSIQLEPPVLTPYNNYTSDSTLDFVANIFSYINFNLTANQLVTNWVWLVNNINQSNNFDNLTHYLNSVSSKQVAANATNANGTSPNTQWNITINVPPETDASFLCGGVVCT